MSQPENTRPLVSIIIPAYNAETYIRKTVESCLQQTYPEVEIIVVDDGSKDYTAHLIERLGKERIRLIRKENGGPSSARNLGLDEAHGDYILFVDADDWLEANACEVLVKEAEEQQADIVIFDYWEEHGRNSRRFHLYPEAFIMTPDHNSEALYDMRTIPVWGKLYRSERIRNIRFNESVHISEDVLFNFEAYPLSRKAVYLPVPLLHYRILGHSAVHGYKPQMEEQLSIPFSRALDFLKKNRIPAAAVYSFLGIGYLLTVQTQIDARPRTSLKEKGRLLCQLNQNPAFQLLFKKQHELNLPLSRRLFIEAGRRGLYPLIALMIAVKRQNEEKYAGRK